VIVPGLLCGLVFLAWFAYVLTTSRFKPVRYITTGVVVAFVSAAGILLLRGLYILLVHGG
jgi:Ni/Fe-hydrogenase subunit HybB-like protein